MKITPQQVIDALTARGACFIPCHACSLCGYPCGYHFTGNDLYYDHGCDCSSRQNTSPRTAGDLAEWVNMQSKPENAERIWRLIEGEKAA